MGKYIVVGAGILGASTAYHLTKSGSEVVLFDKNTQGQATDAAAGLICPWLSQRRNKAWYLLAKNGAKYYPELIKDLTKNGAANAGYRQVGAISIHHSQEKLDQLLERALKRKEDAPEMGEIRLLSKEETKEVFPLLSEEYAALYVSGAARVDGRELLSTLVEISKSNGATFLETSVDKIVVAGNRAIGVEAGGKIFEADGVIITTGAWAGELLSPLGLEIDIYFQKGQIIHLHLEDYETNDWPVVIPPGSKDILPFDEGKVVIGSTHEEAEEFDTKVTAGGLHEILEKALQVAPGLKKASFVEARVGFRPYTPGFLPIIGPVPHFDNLYLANGLGASGLTVGPYLGAQLAKLATRKSPDIDLSPYDVSNAMK